MVSLIPKQVKKAILDGFVAETTWKVALLTTGFTYNHNTHYTYASVSGNEVAGTGYTVGGAALSGRVASYVDTTTVMLDANNVSWGPGATFSNVKYPVVYDTTTGLIRAIYEYTTTKSVSDGTFTIEWHDDGLIRIT